MIRPMTPTMSPPSPQTGKWQKFRLLMWKNFLLQKRHPFQTLFDLLIPILGFILLAYMQKIYFPKNHSKPTNFDAFDINSLSNSLWKKYDPQMSFPPIKNPPRIIFYPNNTVFYKIMDEVRTKLGVETTGINDIHSFELEFERTGSVAGIEFQPSTNNETPKNLAYSLRFPGELRTTQMSSKGMASTFNWMTNKLFSASDFHSPRNLGDSDGGYPSYFYEGFLTIQNAIAMSFIKLANATLKLPEIQMKRLPYPPYVENIQFNVLQSIGPMFIIFCFNYTFSNTTRFVAVEKEKQLKEAMKVMGLPSGLHWLSWFVRTMIMLMISVVFIMILITRAWFDAPNAVFPNSNPFLLGLFFIIYCICLTTFSFLISVFFSTSKTAVTAATAAWYLSYLPFFFTNVEYEAIPGYLKILCCLFPNTAMGYGIKLIARHEESGLGLTWSTIWKSSSVYDNLTVGTIALIMLVMSVVFILLTLYIESIFPGSYGVAKPWYFPFTKEFWNRSQSHPNYKTFDNQHDSTIFNRSEIDEGNFEADPTNERVGVEIRNLCKMYDNKQVAVRNFSFSIYNNQITVLLGHNGAGKTTTISMITGMIEQTSGSILINGYDTRHNIDLARTSISFCPQHNILFDELTVREHILFYSRLKGLSSADAEEEVKKYVPLLELESKIDAMSQTLSGGMKRKLSIGIALCGKSQVVFCDEPTSGMDPAARRSLLNVLIEEKKDRVILMTTHFMDETEIADRIAIMSHGELKCCGSTFFLKKKFGTGYYLVCAKNDNSNSNAVTRLLKKYLPGIEIESENESEIFYQLPDDKVELFQEIFTDLEQNESNLNLKSFGVSLTTMEEIFMRFGRDSPMNHDKSDNNLTNASQTRSAELVSENSADTRLTINGNALLLQGTSLLTNQSLAMIKKRFLIWLRGWKGFLFYHLFIFFILGSVLFPNFSFWRSAKGLPPMDISLNAYKQPFALAQTTQNSNDIYGKLMEQYQNTVKSQSTKANVVNTTEAVDAYLMKLAKTSLSKVKFQYLAAASAVADGTIFAWFNGQFYHTAPLALDLVHNAIMQVFSPGHSVHVTNAPMNYLPVPSSNSTTPEEISSSFGLTFSIVIGMVLSITSAIYINFYIKERECNAKFLQFVSGTNISVFWITSILWDVFTSAITSIFIVILVLWSQQEFWSDFSTLGVLLLILILYHFAKLPIVCILSLIFSKPTVGTNILSFLDMFISILFFANKFGDFLPAAVATGVSFYPQCALMDSLIKLSNTDSAVQTCKKICRDTPGCDSICSMPECCPNLLFSCNDNSVSKDLVNMIIMNLVGLVILLTIEYRLFDPIVSYILGLIQRKLPPVETEEELLDDDVRAIKEHINGMSVDELKSENVVLQNVSKFYGNFVAVNQVSLEVKQAECFGLLGNNGAGKTSLFKMLTGDVRITRGQAYLHGHSIKSEMSSIYKFIGYCPQFDALIDNLTARETLEIFAMVRGLPRNEVSNYAVRLATDLDFAAYLDKKCAKLSGGNKRKLSTAIALTGNPIVIFLDEPTTGMDPATKRNLWTMVNKLRDQGKSIVLTSHSIDECEALCTRLTIMVNGNCKCYGSSQHLKNKFTNGFELKVKIQHSDESNANVIAVKDFISKAFVGATLTDEYQGMLTYMIPMERMKWSTIFGMMENGKKTHQIVDYSVSQNTLEQVLLSFVKNQRARQENK